MFNAFVEEYSDQIFFQGFNLNALFWFSFKAKILPKSPVFRFKLIQRSSKRRACIITLHKSKRNTVSNALHIPWRDRPHNSFEMRLVWLKAPAKRFERQMCSATNCVFEKFNNITHIWSRNDAELHVLARLAQLRRSLGETSLRTDKNLSIFFFFIPVSDRPGDYGQRALTAVEMANFNFMQAFSCFATQGTWDVAAASKPLIFVRPCATYCCDNCASEFAMLSSLSVDLQFGSTSLASVLKTLRIAFSPPSLFACLSSGSNLSMASVKEQKSMTMSLLSSISFLEGNYFSMTIACPWPKIVTMQSVQTIMRVRERVCVITFLYQNRHQFDANPLFDKIKFRHVRPMQTLW